MRKNLIAAFIAVIFIGTTVIMLFSNWVVRDIYRNEVKKNLINILEILEDEVVNKGEYSSYNNQKLDALAQHYSELFSKATTKSGTSDKIRVTIIDYSGNVLGESETSSDSMENHIDRKEIQQALQEEIGSDTRFSKTIRVNLMYVARAVREKEIILRLAIPLTGLKAIYLKIFIYSFIAFMTAVALTWRFSVKMSEYLILPIKRITDATSEIAAGNYNRRVNVKARHEIGELVNIFNKMAEALENNIYDLKEQNIKFDTVINSLSNGLIAVNREYNVILINPAGGKLLGIEDCNTLIGKNILEVVRNSSLNDAIKDTVENSITCIDEINISLDEDRIILRLNTNPIKPIEGKYQNSGGLIFLTDITKIKKLEEMRTDFVSNVTHELKTPLTSIRGFVETLKSGAIEDKAVAYRFLDIIDIEAERLFQLINDILQLSEIETIKTDTNITTFSAYELLYDVVEIVSGAAKSKGVSVSLEADEYVRVKANRNRMKQLFINLADNAIKYNKQDGNVTIKVIKNKSIIAFEVEDTGIGISKENQERIFERFYRVDKGRSRNMGGTGLGLSIVKHIVNLYHGSIEIESNEGSGTKFIIKLPIADN